ncbi:MAG: phosphate uptake regulator PhoU [Halobacteriota archaeon]|nr:phosphate uptake regulator PhoU [Halobacteriota archaeon]
MESRKIQTSASGSYFITLPKSWVQKSGLNHGDRVELSMDANSLSIFPPNKSNIQSTEVSLNLEDYNEPLLFERQIVSCYIRGYDIININSKKIITQEWKRLIKNFIIHLTGTEISEEFSDRIAIRTLVDPSKFPIKELLKRICVIISSMHEDAIIALKDGNQELALDVINRFSDADKLYRLLLRQLMLSIEDKAIAESIGIKDIKDCVVGAIAGRDLNKMAFYVRDMAIQINYLKDEKIDESLLGALINLSNVAIEMQREATKSFFKNDFVRANKVIDRVDWVQEFDMDVTEKIMKKNMDTKIAIILTNIIRDIKRVATYAVGIAQTAQVKVAIRL